MAPSRSVLTEVLADGGPEQLCQQTNSHGEPLGLRHILISLIEEYARHIGHADLVREPVGGLVGEDPRAAGGLPSSE